MNDLQVDQSQGSNGALGTQNGGNFDRNIIKNFKGFDPNMSVNSEVETKNTNKKEKLERRTLERATLSPFTSGEKFFDEIKSQYENLKQAYINNCGGEKYASPEVLQVIDAKLGNKNDDVGIKCSSYWQRRAEVQDFKDIIKMYNLDLCGRSLWHTYNEEPDGSLLPKELKTIFDKAVSSETPVDINSFEFDMNEAIASYNFSIVEKLKKEIEFKAKVSEERGGYLSNVYNEGFHTIVEEEVMRRRLGLETGFINKDISKMKEGLKNYPVLEKVVSYKLSDLKRHGKSSSLRTEAKRIMNRAYQIKAQLDEFTRLGKNENNSENRISLGRCKEFENKLILLFNKSANNDKDFTAGLNEIKAEINKEKMNIANQIFIANKIKNFSENSAENQISQPQQRILNSLKGGLESKLKTLGKDGLVELSKNKDAEKLIKRAERVADEIRSLEGSGLEEIEIPTKQDDVNQIGNENPFLKDFEEGFGDSDDNTKNNDNNEGQNLVKRTKKDEFKEQLENVFGSYANEKDFDRELNKVLVGINQAKISIDNKKFIEGELEKFDKKVNEFYSGVSVNQNNNENQASSARRECFVTKTLKEALEQFAQGKKGGVVSLRNAAGATGVLNRGEQITGTLKSLREHLNKEELSAEEYEGFVGELNELYSELATAKGFGRKLKGIEAKINEAVAVNVAKAKKESTITSNNQYIEGQGNRLKDKIDNIGQQAQELNISLDGAKIFSEAFVKKLGALTNDGSIDFQSNAGVKNNIQRMYDKTIAAVTYLRHIGSGRSRGLLTEKEYDKYKEEFKKCFSDSLEKPRESAEAFEAKLGKIYAGAKKLRKERISDAYDNRIGEVIRDIGLHLQLSQVKNFAKAVFKADGITSEDFSNALAKLKKKVLGKNLNRNDENGFFQDDDEYDGSFENPLQQRNEQLENSTEVNEEQFRQLTAEDDKGLRNILGNKARELARTHFAGGKGSRKEFENKLGVLLDRAQKIQGTINNWKKIELNEKQKQRLFKLMDVSFPKVLGYGFYNDSKFRSGLEKFKREIGIIDEIPQENPNVITESLLGPGQTDNNSPNSQGNQVDNETPVGEDPFIREFEEQW